MLRFCLYQPVAGKPAQDDEISFFRYFKTFPILLFLLIPIFAKIFCNWIILQDISEDFPVRSLPGDDDDVLMFRLLCQVP